ncbi:MAG: hypothetical protein M3O41_09335 [Pseudomonadota bacterium]|nr:hypothetical protein [Pseudomonadota bacterium]
MDYYARWLVRSSAALTWAVGDAIAESAKELYYHLTEDDEEEDDNDPDDGERESIIPDTHYDTIPTRNRKHLAVVHQIDHNLAVGE